MNGQDAAHCLDLDYNHRFDQHVEAISHVQAHLAVYHGHRLLSFHRESTALQLICKTSLVSRFQQSRTQRAVHVDGGADCLIGHPIDCLWLDCLRVLCALCGYFAPRPAMASVPKGVTPCGDPASISESHMYSPYSRPKYRS